MLDQGGGPSRRHDPLLFCACTLTAQSSGPRIDAVAFIASLPSALCRGDLKQPLEPPPCLPCFSGLEADGGHDLDKCRRDARLAKHRLQLGLDLPDTMPYGGQRQRRDCTRCGLVQGWPIAVGEERRTNEGLVGGRLLRHKVS